MTLPTRQAKSVQLTCSYVFRWYFHSTGEAHLRSVFVYAILSKMPHDNSGCPLFTEEISILWNIGTSCECKYTCAYHAHLHITCVLNVFQSRKLGLTSAMLPCLEESGGTWNWCPDMFLPLKSRISRISGSEILSVLLWAKLQLMLVLSRDQCGTWWPGPTGCIRDLQHLYKNLNPDPRLCHAMPSGQGEWASCHAPHVGV